MLYGCRDSCFNGVSPGTLLRQTEFNGNVCSSSELALVVSGGSNPFVQHGDGIVDICAPTAPGYVKMPQSALCEENFPFRLLNDHFNADGTEILLKGFGHRDVGGGGVGDVVDLYGGLSVPLGGFYSHVYKKAAPSTGGAAFIF